MASKDRMITIEVAYAEPEQQWLLEEKVPEGTTVGEALEKSLIHEYVPHLKIEKFGVWNKLAKPDQVLRDGDRIEIYRPLKVDPKARRRKQAEKAGTGGKNRAQPSDAG